MPEGAIDTSAKDEPSRFKMLWAGRCDFAIADVEPLQGSVNLGLLSVNGLDKLPVPDFTAKSYFALISKNDPRGSDILKALNEGLSAMRADGSYKKILRSSGH